MPPIKEASSDNETVESGRATVAGLSVGSWVLYDVANTVFFTGIHGIFFPLWVVQDMGGSDGTIGFTVAGAMLANLLIAPIFGAMSDGARRRLPLLAVLSMVGIASTFLLGTLSLDASLVLFGISLIAMHTGVVVYNAMLVDVSTRSNRGLIGGIGVGIGYLGVLLVIVIGLTVAESHGYVMAFRAVGALMLVLTLPVVVLMRERPREPSPHEGEAGHYGAIHDAARAIRDASRYPGLVKLFAGRFFYYLTVYTASLFAFIYGTETIGFSEQKMYLILGGGTLTAILSAPAWGWLSDRLGPYMAMRFVLIGWLLALSGAIAIPWLGLPDYLYWLVGIASGLLVAGTWVIDRPLLLMLIPEERAGQFFGIYSLTGRLGMMVGPAIWAFIASSTPEFGIGVKVGIGLGLGQTAAICSLVVSVALAVLVLGSSGREVERNLAGRQG